jgi:hypothetical protein
MNKEELLRSFLEDDSMVKDGYLRKGEAESFKWTDRPNDKLISVLREVIMGESNRDSNNVIERKINQIFNNQT